MAKCNPDNERIKRAYFEWLKEANQKSDSTIDNVRKAIDRFEVHTEYKDFKPFNKRQATGFKKQLSQSRTTRTKEPLSKSTIVTTTRHLKDFFKWLAYRPGYKKIDLNDVEYFNLSEKEIRAARSKKIKRAPTIEQIKMIISSMPAENEIHLRNRALIAFTLLTGIRDGAMATLRLKHIKVSEELVEQMPNEVKTKFSKTIYTYFFPVGDEIKQIVIDWVEYLFTKKLFNDDDPLFPRTMIVHDENNSFKPIGVEPYFWHSASQIRAIFKEAFRKAGLEYFSPHSFRNTLTRLGERICQTPEEFKAWSQNLGHEQVLTTFTSYGQIDEYNQGEVIKRLSLDGSQKPEARLKEIDSKLDILLRQKVENNKK